MRTVYYDIESDNQYAPYAKLDVTGLRWDDGKVEYLGVSRRDLARVRQVLGDPNIKKVGFNNSNFDDIVLARHGVRVAEENRHDGFFAIKTLHPEFPSFSLKFCNWLLFGDFHWPEYELEKSQLEAGAKSKFIGADEQVLKAYNLHDLIQHEALWNYCEPKLVGRHLEAYLLDLSTGPVSIQMSLQGGIFVNRADCERQIYYLERARERNMERAREISGGKLTNANSNKQLGAFFEELEIDMDFTPTGGYKIDKALIEIIWRDLPVAKCVKNVRKIDSILKYYRNYLAALDDPTYERTATEGFLPTSISFSTASTRRATSSSMYKINFQNPSEYAKKVQVVPSGWLYGAMDATQIENVVHMYESRDYKRIEAYRADEDYSEYVWLCNEILRTNLTKKELDAIKSKQNENWSVYKQYKTTKLMMNFGGGAKKFSLVTGIEERKARKIFNDIHRACPAIRLLQDRVARELTEKGEVYDVFGHVYRGKPEMAYKVVAYMIQGTGTGSLNKAQIRANYDTLMSYNELYDEPIAFISLTTHDEISFYINKEIGEEQIENILADLMFNMTKKFEHKFDGIPLRSKLYLSDTKITERKEVRSYAEFINRSR